MSFWGSRASFEEQVVDLLSAYRGRGLMLSALDAHLLASWARASVPVEVIARGMEKAAQSALWDARPGEAGVRSLRACRRHVEAEIHKHLERATGKSICHVADARAPLEEQHHHRVALLGTLVRRQPSLRKCIQALEAGVFSRHPDDFQMAELNGMRAAFAILRALPFGERLSILRQAQACIHPPPLMSSRARKTQQRFHRCRALWTHLSVPGFW